MNKGLIELFELVYEINQLGGDLVVDFRKSSFSIHDCNNGCEQFLKFNKTYYNCRNAIYFDKEFGNVIDDDIISAKKQLIKYMEGLK